MTRRLTTTALFVALLLVAAGCGGSDSQRDQAIVDAFIEDIVGDVSPFTQDRDEARCVAEKTYDVFGSERLSALGITAESPDPSDADLSDDEAEGVVDAVFSCIDMKASFVNDISGPDLSVDDATCIVDELGDDFLRDAARAGLLNPDAGPSADLFENLTAAAGTCGVPLN